MPDFKCIRMDPQQSVRPLYLAGPLVDEGTCGQKDRPWGGHVVPKDQVSGADYLLQCYQSLWQVANTHFTCCSGSSARSLSHRKPESSCLGLSLVQKALTSQLAKRNAARSALLEAALRRSQQHSSTCLHTSTCDSNMC